MKRVRIWMCHCCLSNFDKRNSKRVCFDDDDDDGDD